MYMDGHPWSNFTLRTNAEAFLGRREGRPLVVARIHDKAEEHIYMNVSK